MKLKLLSLLLVNLLSSLSALANPIDGEVVHGQAIFSHPTVNTLNITNTPGTIINWQQFSIQNNETTRFIQQGATSSVLNRVVSQSPSDILGNLVSNGRVFVINPNGIVFGEDSVINTAGLVASTLNIKNEDFLAGNYHFEGDGGAIQNKGYIKAGPDGDIFLIAPNIENSGIIKTDGGQLMLAAGQSLTIASLDSDHIVFDVQAPEHEVVNLGELITRGGAASVFAGTIRNNGAINADAISVDDQGRVTLFAQDLAYLDEGSRLSANSDSNQAGEIDIEASLIYQLGDIEANGDAGGTIQITAENYFQSSDISAIGETSTGGTVSIQADEIIQTTSSMINVSSNENRGGVIHISSPTHESSSLFTSGAFNATGDQGGSVVLTAADVILRDAAIDASGTNAGGNVYIGGGWQGADTTIENARSVDANFSNSINASATDSGNGGTVVVWSDQKTHFMGAIDSRGGAIAGNGGAIEVSGKQDLVFGGSADASAENGEGGVLLLDPVNVIVEDSVGGPGGAGIVGTIDLVDPNIGSGDMFSSNVLILSNGNIIASDPNDDFAAADAGAVYLFDGTTGALISSLTGGAASDQVGNFGITQLFSSGKFLILTPDADVGGFTDNGAVTFADNSTGVNGILSTTNSLVGASSNDQLGLFGITQLFSTGNYLVLNPNTDIGGVANVGSVTLGDGTTGITGVVSSANSLVGSVANDQIGNFGVTQLNAGKLLVRSPNADVGGFVDAGAVTFGDATTGITGVVSSANSLVGGANGDLVGDSVVSINATGNYVVMSAFADIGGITDSGAVTLGDGTTGITGVISATNSLVGATAGDQVGRAGVQILNNGNYLVRSPDFDFGGMMNVGAITFGDGMSGITGVVNATNSLVGSGDNDQLGLFNITQLFSGNYLVSNINSDIGGLIDAGSVTFGDGTTGVSGVISSSNSLVGSAANDQIGSGGITQLISGNIVVASPDADIGGFTDAGAVTFIDGTTGLTGIVAASNSLVGGANNDQVGSFGITQLFSTGNYLISSPDADVGGILDSGAVTFADGTTGITGVISSANSLAGGAAADRLGSNFITQLFNSGNYVVLNPGSDIGGLTDAGSATFGDGTTGITGVISSTNSLVGGAADDQVGSFGVNEFSSSGNFTISSPNADIAGVLNTGAVTFVDVGVGITGVISSTNSLVGSGANDNVGNFGVIELFSSGKYLIPNSNADVGGIVNAGAVTFGDTTTGVTGVISATNSLVGSATNDFVGSFGVTPLSNGNYIVNSPEVDLGGMTDVGAVSFGDGTTGLLGAVSSTNSLVGGATGDMIGSGFITQLFSTGNYLVVSPSADIGGLADTGAVTFGNGTTGVTGVVSATNSLVGGSANDQIGNFGVTQLFSTGNYLVNSPDADIGGVTDAGAVTFGDGNSGVTGTVSATNSLVGGSTGDRIGSNFITQLSSSGNYVVINTGTDVGGLVDVGSVTLGNGNTGITGVVTASNSLVGGAANDRIGSFGITQLFSSGNFLIRSPDVDNGGTTDVGAVTFSSGTSGVVGVVSDTNSLLGASAGDRIGSGFLTTLNSGNYLVVNTGTDIGGLTNVGSITFGDSTTGVTGIISSTNSLLGTSANDNLGSGGVTSLSGDLFLIRSPQYDNGAVDTGRLQIGSATSAGGGGSVGPGMVPVMFGDNLGGDVTVTALQITAITDSGTAVVLQASNDLTINSDIVSNNIAGAGGDLIFEAGRSVIINADIFTDDGLLDITANSDLVNGVIDADRLLGPAMISMADGTTLNSGLGDLIITLESGSGLSNTEAGDMILENIIANHIDLTVNSQTDNSDILRASADALITASSLFIDHDPIAGNGGSIGTASEPLLVQVNNLSAHTHANSPGIFINSADPGQDVILGDTFFGLSHFIQGVETVASGNIVLNIAGNVTVNKTVLSAGDLDINTTGTSSNLVVNAPISATSNLNMNVSGDIVITDVTVNGAAGVQSSSGSLQLISNLAPVQLTSSGNLNIDNTGNLILQGSDTSSGGSAKVLAEGEIIINAASVNLNAGDADFAFASIDPLLLELTLSGDLNLTGGAGQMSDAQLQADTVNIMTTGNVNLTAGTGDDSSAIINGQASDVTIDAAQIELQAGTGANADALVIADLGNGNINVMAPTCTNCDPIDADPILDATAQNGFFGIQVAQTATTDVPDNQQVVVLESFTDEINEEDVTSVTAINTVTTEDGDEEEEEELLECRA